MPEKYEACKNQIARSLVWASQNVYIVDSLSRIPRDSPKYFEKYTPEVRNIYIK